MENKIVNSLEDIPSRYRKNWNYISEYKFLSESFIEKHIGKISWYSISKYQTLSESFIEKFQDDVDWDYISYSQILSESFIIKHQDKIDWVYISSSQILSESFIEKFQNKVKMFHISSSQILSESFIEKFQDKVDWEGISYSQILSESFIDKYQDRVMWYLISSSQILSKEFLKKYKDRINIDLYNKCHKEFSYEERLADMTAYAKEYGLEFDGKYLYAYRQHDKFGRGMWNKTIRYEVGKYYRDWYCDMDIDEDASFGLGIYPKGNVKVKVSVDDWGLHLKQDYDGKCRVWGFEVLEHN